MRLSRWLLLLPAILLGVLILLVLTVRGSSCEAERECDAFKPVCASYDGEHQFFYSDCDRVRANCLTGENWKRDYFSHCNVYQ